MAGENYQLQMEQVMQTIAPGTPLLLHSCCGPCSSSVLERLASHFSVTLQYYNPNIWPGEEYQRRKAEQLRLLEEIETGYPVQFLDSPWDDGAFYRAVEGLETQPEGGARCTACFSLRLREAARQTARLGFHWFTTTLTVSPHKNAACLNETGRRAAEEYGVRFLPSDFKKKDGYRRSLELAREHSLYRQDYCGCVFSRKVVEPRAVFRVMTSRIAPFARLGRK